MRFCDINFQQVQFIVRLMDKIIVWIFFSLMKLKLGQCKSLMKPFKPLRPTILSRASETGLQQTAWAATRHGARDPFWSVHRWNRPTGEPLIHVKHLTIDKLENHLDKKF